MFTRILGLDFPNTAIKRHYKKLKKDGFDAYKEYQHHPEFGGEPLESFIKMDLMVKMPRRNVIIECKSIKNISDKEQLQTFGYLRENGIPDSATCKLRHVA